MIAWGNRKTCACLEYQKLSNQQKHKILEHPPDASDFSEAESGVVTNTATPIITGMVIIAAKIIIRERGTCSSWVDRDRTPCNSAPESSAGVRSQGVEGSIRKEIASLQHCDAVVMNVLSQSILPVTHTISDRF